MKNRILAALQGEYDKHDLPKVGTVMDDVYKVIFCPVCGNKTLDNYYICHHCGWEYDGFPEYHYSAANGATLHEYRRAYEKLKKGENYMQVSIYSRQAIIELMKTGFPENTAVISFYSPQKISKPEKRVDFSGSCDRVFYVRIPDIDIEILHDHGYTYDTYLSEADDLVKFIYEARNDGLNIICQCDYGQSRSAACAAAILQHFEGRGIDIFTDYRYYPNQLVYHKVFEALERISSRTIKIEDNVWCDLKVASNKCLYTFFPSHIPSEYGGDPDADIIQGAIECDSNENANRCLQAIESLIENGYDKTLNWLIALDMGDIMTYIFNGESMKFLHQGIDALQTSDLAKHLAEAKTVFAYFELSNDCKSTAYYESVFAEISSISNASVWSQVCYHSKDICNVHLWYR